MRASITEETGNQLLSVAQEPHLEHHTEHPSFLRLNSSTYQNPDHCIDYNFQLKPLLDYRTGGHTQT
jgi:hypothetical protein